MVKPYLIFDRQGNGVDINNMFDKTYWDYAAVGTITGTNQASLIDRAAEPGRNVVASVEFKY